MRPGPTGLWQRRFPAFIFADFRRIFVNGFFATGSRWAEILARGWLVHELSDGSSAAVGWVTFASFFPFVVVGPFVGALADRFDRRRLLIAATTFGLLGALALAAVTLTDVVQVWHVVALAFATGAAQAATVPTRQSLIANVVDHDHLLNAIAIGGIARHGSRIVGPLFGAAMLRSFGAGSVFLLSAGLLCCALIAVVRIEHRSAHAVASDPDADPATFGSLVEGIRDAVQYIRRDTRLLTVIGLVAAHCSFTMAFDSMMPALSDRVGGGSTLYSSILIGLGAGAMTGTLLVSQLETDRSKGSMFAAVGIGSGLAMLIMGTATTGAVVVIGAVLAGFTQASYMTMSATLVQTVVTDDYRGRVMSVYIMIAAGHMAFVNLGFGRLADATGVPVLLIVPGLLWIAVFIGGYAVLTGVRSLVRRGRFDSMEPALAAP